MKADALATAGACAIGLLGVDMWHDDDAWDRIPLEDRRAVIAFDSDARSNPNVHGATARLAAYLRQRGARVQFLELPQDHGKVGVDDYLAGGHTLEDLWQLVADELAPLPAEPAPTAPPALVLLNLVDRLLRRYVWFPTEHHSRTLALWVPAHMGVRGRCGDAVHGADLRRRSAAARPARSRCSSSSAATRCAPPASAPPASSRPSRSGHRAC